jgi:hypothetical protein
MMSRREFTYLGPDQVAGEIIDLISTAIARDQRFPTLSPLELALLFADARDEIETGLDEFASGLIETIEASNDE